MLFRKEQLFRYKKYLTLNVSHFTLKKIINMIRVEWRLKTCNHDMKGLNPYILFVDMFNTCNLKCPLCVMGRRKVIHRDALMDIEHYKRVVMPLKDYLIQVFLYNNSEPFLNNDIYDIIALNRKWNIGSVVSSNLSLKVDSRRLVESGLEYLILSADGLTQDVYSQYRINGNLEMVINNIKSIVDMKRSIRSKTPFIEWQSLVTSKNEHQLEEIKDYAYSLGVDTVRFANINFYSNQDELFKTQQEWLPSKPEFRSFEKAIQSDDKKRKRKPCYWLWRTAIISSNGEVIPCCLFDTMDWGNIFEQSFPEIWNNNYYLKARRLSTSYRDESLPIICDDCNADFIYR